MSGLMVRAFKEKKDEDIVRWLEIADDINVKDDRDMTALMHATILGMKSSVTVLLKAGANPTLQSCSGDTALRKTIIMIM
jgi:ankyrin repeat protein